MDVESKIAVLKSFAAEIVTEQELEELLGSNAHPLVYDGFEPSGLAHLPFGIYRSKNIKKMLDIGMKFNIYIADYFAFVNKKMGGNIDHIRDVGRYFIEVWKAAGIDSSKVNIVWSKDLMNDFGYWECFMTAGKQISLDRVRRATTIMGRKEGEALEAAQLFYPVMQVTDVIRMGIDICQLGMDQRKANMLAREVTKKLGLKVPVAVHHKYILGLKGAPKNLMSMSDDEAISYKMSKSDPKSSILVHDSEETIKEKVMSAYCPERVIEGNPMFDYLENLIVDDKGAPIRIERSEKYGGPIEAKDYEELERLYREGKVHPYDLKMYVAEALNVLVKPIREHFEKNKAAKELYEKVKSYQITR
ncbi:tyrosine--tRNA ligase [Candidatus Marsarchaeota archaeon]|nr:tyrosine--tRNA ligase [Candidatus Marsarchaeota archaeon]MCL5404238.1 tyrosine--tRNA ligase [Candidatus Marsarchaeota archaeon]